MNKTIVKKNKTVKVVGKQKTNKAVKVEPSLLKAQAFLEKKNFGITALRSRAVYAVAYFMKNKAVKGKVYKAVDVLKGNTSSLFLFGSDTRKAIALKTGMKVTKLELKEGNSNLCYAIKLS